MSPCMIGAPEILLICGIVLLIFGGKKLPELMKGMGKGIRSFKEGLSESSDDEPQKTDEEGKDQNSVG